MHRPDDLKLGATTAITLAADTFTSADIPPPATCSSTRRCGIPPRRAAMENLTEIHHLLRS